MRLDLYVEIKYKSSTIILFVVLDILYVTYFLISITMSDLQTSDMHYI